MSGEGCREKEMTLQALPIHQWSLIYVVRHSWVIFSLKKLMHKEEIINE